MAYVLDYSSFHWRRKAAIRRAALSSVLVAAAAAGAAGLRVRAVSRRPTFADVVTLGVAEPGESVRSEPLDATARRVYAVADAWGALRADYGRWAPYLRLAWAPRGAAFTNALDAVSAIATAQDVPRSETSSGPALAVDSAEIRFRGVSDADLYSEARGASRPRPLSFGVKWRTTAPFGPEKGVEIRDFATNAVSLAARPWTPDSAPSAAGLKFADGGRAAEPVEASWTLPGMLALPVSPQLSAVTNALSAMSAALRKTKLGDAPNGLSGEMTLEALQSRFGGRARNDFDARKAEYERSLDPGAWLSSRHPAAAFGPTAQPFAEELYRRWSRATAGRLPWERGLMDSFMRGSNFVSAASLRAFASSLPAKSEIERTKARFDEKAAGLTNALRAALFAPFDAVPDEKRAAFHDTVDLLSFGAETGVLPPGAPPVPAATNSPGAVQTFRVRFPTAVNPGGSHVVVRGKADLSSRCTLATWTYSLLSTNFPVAVSAVAYGFREFFGAGWGYEPETASLEFAEGGGVVRLDASGVVPVLLDGEAPAAAGAKRPGK